MKYPIDLYKRETPRWILESEDDLTWAGIGGEVGLSVKELRNVIKRIDRLIKLEKQKGEKK